MTEELDRSALRRVIFLLVPDFSMLAFTSALEPLRAANRAARRRIYDWRVMSMDGEAVQASNGVTINPDGIFETPEQCDMLVVCAGMHPELQVNTGLIKEVKRWRRAARQIGGVCTGSHILAQAGLLDGYRCTIHWEDLSSFIETFPDLAISARLFEIDRDRFTCSGGIAPLDLMVDCIRRDCGRELAAQVSELMLHPEAREATAPQRVSLAERTGIHHPKMLAALERMERNIETPETLEDLASASDLSPRQLERLFQAHFGRTPKRYYMDLRLARARHLLRHTAMPVLEIAIAAGFSSAAHFAKCYREAYGYSPKSERNFVDPQAAA